MNYAKKISSKKSDGNDFTAVFVLNGVTVGIGSIGDTRSEIEKNFDFFESYLCSVCVCNARTKCGTQDFSFADGIVRFFIKKGDTFDFDYRLRSV